MRTLRQLYLLLFLLALPVTGYAQRTILPDRIDARDAQSAITALVGAGIQIGDVSSRPYVAAATGDVIWKVLRDDTAPDGTRHVLYQQMLRRPDGTEARLAGAEVAVHFRKSGELLAVDGRQFTNVRLEGGVRFSPRDALLIAHDGLIPERGFRRGQPLTETDIAAREKNTELLLLTEDGATFRYAYWTVADDAGPEKGMLVDAENMTIRRAADLSVNNNCAPSNPSASIPATGYPVRPDLSQQGVRRSLFASAAPDRSGLGFEFDGYWLGGPSVTVLQQTNNGAFMCQGQLWTLFPVGMINRAPVYANTNLGWNGSAAGDAMHRTRETMNAFHTMGRLGYDGRDGDATIIIESTMCGAANCGTFVRLSRTPDPRVPVATDVVAVAPVSVPNPNNPDRYNITAAMDIIAHEWGHGVIYSSFSNFDPATNPVWQQLHEGFADVIGQMVEKLREPLPPCQPQRDGSCLEVPSGPEQSGDWDIGEDASAIGQYLRSGNRDDGPGGHLYFDGGVNNLFHRTDVFPQQPHDYGNMLNVVFYLLTKGGANPACARFNNCNIVVPALGFQTAAQILFDTVQFTARPNSRWEDLAQQASLAAFNRYGLCERGYSAAGYQDAVDKAFSAIGYPRTTPPYTCP